MSSIPSYLWLSRHSIFYFRVVVPSVLRPLFPCGEIRRSLQTRCKREALIRGRELLLQVQKLYTQAFQGIRLTLDSLHGAWEAGGKRVASWAAWLRQQQLVHLAASSAFASSLPVKGSGKTSLEARRAPSRVSPALKRSSWAIFPATLLASPSWFMSVWSINGRKGSQPRRLLINDP